MPRESRFQTRFQNDLREIFPGIVIVKAQTGFIQGFTDRLLLYRDKWAALEFKESAEAVPQVNQPYWVDLLNTMSYAAFVYPENGRDVLRDLQLTFQPSGSARYSFR
jgi:hypothetical protein